MGQLERRSTLREAWSLATGAHPALASEEQKDYWVRQGIHRLLGKMHLELSGKRVLTDEEWDLIERIAEWWEGKKKEKKAIGIVSDTSVDVIRLEDMNAYASDIVLGRKYRDNATGIEGTATSIHFYLHACERVTLRTLLKDGELVEYGFDAPELTDVETNVTAQTDRPGGPPRADGGRTLRS